MSSHQRPHSNRRRQKANSERSGSNPGRDDGGRKWDNAKPAKPTNLASQLEQEHEEKRTKRGMNQRSPTPPVNRNPKGMKRQRSNLASENTSLRSKNLDVVSFALARTRELEMLRKHLTPKPHRVKRVYQQLSWHARRRTMSHSSKRMPMRMRYLHERELAQQTIKKNKIGVRKIKKYRNKRRFLKALRKLRCAKHLETHVWHAKRFRMKTLKNTNLKIASFSNDRGIRSMTRCINNHCICHDQSYLNVIQLAASTSEGDLKLFLKQLIHPNEFLKLSIHVNNCKGENENKLFHSVLIHNDENVAVAPVDMVIFRDWSKIWLWIRPELSSDVYETIETKMTDDIDVKWVDDKPLRFSLFGPKTEQVLNEILMVESKKMKEIPSCKNCKEGTIIEHGIYYMHENNNPSCAIDESIKGTIWDENVREYYSKLYQPPRPKNEVNNIDRIQVPITLIQHGNLNRSEIYGWDVIVPKGWGMVIWIKILHKIRKRAIGIDELNEVEYYRGNGPILFPQDYLDCEGARKLQSHVDEMEIEKESRRPKGKRRNINETIISLLQKHLSSGKPIHVVRYRQLLLEEYENRVALVNVIITVKGRGVPKKRAVITPKDEHDNVIGVVISGGYAMSNGKGMGRAVVAVDGLRGALRKKRLDKEIACEFRNREDNCEWRRATLKMLFSK